jgi:mediator of RNA polymerase II transcription subunit 14
MVAQNTQALATNNNQGASIPLSTLIDFIVQRTYHDLIVLAELLPRKTDMERKIGKFNFSQDPVEFFLIL